MNSRTLERRDPVVRKRAGTPTQAPETGRAGAGTRRSRRGSYALLWLALAGLVSWGAWTDAYQVDSDLAYWFGVGGASAMLILLLYPLRKRLQRFWPTQGLRYWFAAHMVLGIAGPLLILLHCKLTLGSFNAKVTFWSMLVVAGSGIAGRFLYAQLHAGLYGRQRSAAELRAEAEAALAAAAPLLQRDSPAYAVIGDFARLAADTARRGLAAPWQQLSLPRRARATRRQCLALVLAQSPDGVDPPQLRRLLGLLDGYLETATAAARYGAVERLFSWWHVAHLPLVLILVLTACFHVVAVHMY